ncbi:MAG: carbohydrate ABC transporter permease [Christensenellales bacterium]|jgi:putative aldouronate transport system permease protein
MIASRSQRAFAIFNYFLFVLLSVIMIYPFWDVLRISFSSPMAVSSMEFQLFPKEWDMNGYQAVFNNRLVWSGYRNTLLRTLLGVAISMAAVVLTAYPLSRKDFVFRSGFTMFVVFTMFFSGGMIPTYLLVSKWLRLHNTIWALVLPGAISTYNMLICRNYFMSLPDSLIESARIDGASELRTLLSIVVPLSMPILMTLLLWTIVGHWNAWFDCLIYIQDPEKYVLQAVLRKIVIEFSPSYTDTSMMSERQNLSQYIEVIKCATIMVATLPIICIYPFLQKYFVKGILVGSLKG